MRKIKDLGATLSLNGGKRGIRTLEPREGLPVFKTGVFNRSTSFPPSVLLKNTGGFKALERYRNKLYFCPFDGSFISHVRAQNLGNFNAAIFLLIIF